MNLDNNNNDIAKQINKYASLVDADQIWISIEDQVLADNEAYRKKKKRRLFFVPFLIGLISIAVFIFVDGPLIGTHTVADVSQATVDDESRGVAVDIHKEAVVMPVDITDKLSLNTASDANDIKSTTYQVVSENTPGESTLTAESVMDDYINARETFLVKAQADLNHDRSFSSVHSISDSEKSSGRKVFSTHDQSTARVENSEIKTSISELKNVVVLDQELSSDRHIVLNKLMVEKAIIPVNHSKPKLLESKVSVVGGVSAMDRSLTSVASEQTQWVNARNQFESELTSSHVGINYSVLHRAGWTFSLGINSRVLHERFRYDHVVSDTTFLTELKARYFDLELNQHDVYESVPRVETTTTRYAVINRYRTYELPLLVGYSFVHNKWTLGVNAGVTAQYLHDVSGTISGPQSDVEMLSDELYMSSISVAYRSGMSLGYRLTSALELTMDSYYQAIPNLASSTSGFQHSYQLYGGQLSLGYRF